MLHMTESYLAYCNTVSFTALHAICQGMNRFFSISLPVRVASDEEQRESGQEMSARYRDKKIQSVDQPDISQGSHNASCGNRLSRSHLSG
jgi:hypothetical protein